MDSPKEEVDFSEGLSYWMSGKVSHIEWFVENIIGSKDEVLLEIVLQMTLLFHDLVFTIFSSVVKESAV